MDDLVKKAASDEAFAHQVAADPIAALAKYPELSSDEKAALIALVGTKESIGWRPSSFKDLGAGLLSLATVVLFGIAMYAVLININTPAVYSTIPGTNPVQSTSFQPFDRVQVVFGALLPLFGGLFAYWLGVKVEGQRADAADERAATSDATAKSERDKKEALLEVATPAIVQEAKLAYPKLFEKETR